jgi:hypothetical protein
MNLLNMGTVLLARRVSAANHVHNNLRGIYLLQCAM